MRSSNPVFPFRRVALVGTSVPRQCGIATFTDDLYHALNRADRSLDVSIVAMNDRADGYAYPRHVAFEVPANDPLAYTVAADFLGVSDTDIVCLQHEFGIFGGRAGEHVLALVEGLTAPLVTTLHTVLEKPDRDQLKVMRALIENSARLVVMADKGRQILQDRYGVSPAKIAVIPHGVPDRAFLDPALAKHALDLADRTLLMTFGLLGPGKGIETAIQALPALIRSHPKILYMIVGATHPNLLRSEGEQYRQGLVSLADTLGVNDHIRFVDRYCALDELLDHLAACDIYIAPYPNEAQIVSGTLAYALALGKPVVSTPFWYAEEMLANRRGVIVPFAQPDALAGAVGQLIDDDRMRSGIRARAYEQGRAMIWSRVAQQYLALFDEVRSGVPSLGATILSFPAPMVSTPPAISTAHLAALTDDVGLIQHAKFGVAHRRHGYCLDDNARGLLVMAQLALHRKLTPDEEKLSHIYAAFVEDAFCPTTGRARNFMRFDRTWIEEGAQDDALGRALWALGNVAIMHDERGLGSWAAARLLETAPCLPNCKAPRSWAYGLLGIAAFLKRFPGHRSFEAIRDELAHRLQQRFHDSAGPEWTWFEDRLGYDNARLCEALIVCGHDGDDGAMLGTGLNTLGWLMQLQTAPKGHFRPVGTESFGIDRSPPRAFDQQPLEVWGAVSACLAAADATQNLHWLQEAHRAFAWFFGENDLGLPLVDAERGACFDGLHPDRRNANQGAESTLAYLAAATALTRFAAETERSDAAHCPLESSEAEARGKPLHRLARS